MTLFSNLIQYLIFTNYINYISTTTTSPTLTIDYPPHFTCSLCFLYHLQMLVEKTAFLCRLPKYIFIQK